ncbi:MAG TPA: hypothetical protein PKV80_10090, partial [Leptospiraceae bacterium]|nr:hypothetical protein [Leptospiraceae bacterium]
MESVIDIRKEENVIQQLESVLNEILYAEQNNAARAAFLEATRGLKPESCNVRTGWSAGQWIAFNCTFQKNGNSDIIKEIVKG